jgi:hypothetical protein
VGAPEVIELRAVATETSSAGGQRDVDVRLIAHLSDGREVVVLADRGFSMSAHPVGEALPPPDDEDLFVCAWCVGPDEKHDAYTDRDMAEAHFGSLAEDLRVVGVKTSAEALMTAPFHVDWGPRRRVWPKSLDWY